MSTITNFLFIYASRVFTNWDYFDLNGQALSQMEGKSVDRPTGTFIITTALCVIGIVLLIPYLFVQEHITKPPIKSFSYNVRYIFNNLWITVTDMLHEKNYILFLIAVVGLQYGPLYTTVLFHTIQSDVFHSTEYQIEIKENIFFYTAIISFFITPVLLHKYGPRLLMIIMLALVTLLTCFQITGLFGTVLGYIGCVCGGFASASVCQRHSITAHITDERHGQAVCLRERDVRYHLYALWSGCHSYQAR